MGNERSISLCTTCERLPYCTSTNRFDTVLGCPECISTYVKNKTSKDLKEPEMEESKFMYEIFYADELIASFRRLEDALLFITAKASDSEHYMEPDWRYSIVRKGGVK